MTNSPSQGRPATTGGAAPAELDCWRPPALPRRPDTGLDTTAQAATLNGTGPAA